MTQKLDLMTIVKEENQKTKQNLTEKLLESLTFDRDMMTPFCGWGQQANMISLSARQRVITLTQVIGDGEEYQKRIAKIADKQQKGATLIKYKQKEEVKV